MKSKIDKKEVKRLLSDETIESLTKLGDVLLSIHIRLVKEGKVKVENGKTIFLEKPLEPKRKPRKSKL